MNWHRRSLTFRLTALFGCLFAVTATATVAISYVLTDRTYSSGHVRDGTQQVLTEMGVTIPTDARRGAIKRLLGADVADVVRRIAERARSDALEQLVSQSIIALTITIVVFVPLAWWVARRSLRPLRSMATTAATISATNLRTRLSNGGPDDEVDRLARAFDDTFARLDRVFTAHRHFAAHASHELRTPLTTLRAEAELALGHDTDPVVNRHLAMAAIAAVDRSERLIVSLLALTRAESGAFESTPCSLADLTGDVIGDLAPSADRRKIDIDLSLQDCMVSGDPILLQSLISNLAANAVLHNYEGGFVTISVTSDGRLSVLNSGAEFTAEQVQRLSEPFMRAANDERAPGHGLGLAIVDAIAHAHGATVQRAPRDGGGLATEVCFPILPPLESGRTRPSS